jgi:hypothetical protein
MCHELEAQVNQRRAAMHLAEMGLCSDSVDKAFFDRTKR